MISKIVKLSLFLQMLTAYALAEGVKVNTATKVSSTELQMYYPVSPDESAQEAFEYYREKIENRLSQIHCSATIGSYSTAWSSDLVRQFPQLPRPQKDAIIFSVSLQGCKIETSSKNCQAGYTGYWLDAENSIARVCAPSDQTRKSKKPQQKH